MSLETDLQVAMRLADVADPISLSHFLSESLVVAAKPDGSFVSHADREVESAMRERLSHWRPGDAVLGEEYGAGGEVSPRRWILDPIDGTTRFVRGIPLFASLIALEEDGEMVLGLVSAPALRRRWWAVRGSGAFANGHPIRVSSVSRLEEAHVSLGNPGNWVESGLYEQLGPLARHAGSTTGYGDFWPHLLVAEGAADAALEPSAALWDLAPLKIIVEEAGGRFTDFTGSSTAEGGTALATNGLTHDELLRLLRP